MKIFAVNPGSTSTKIALYENGNLLIRNIEHPSERLLEMPELQDQFDYRKNEIEKVLADTSLTLEGVNAFVGRAGSVSSVTGGTYLVNDLMLDHARNGNPYNQIKHPAMLGPQFVRFFSGKYGGMPLVVNPPDVDEFDEVARITGLKGIYRKSSIHALNQKEVALRYAKEKGIRYEELNLIICHIGFGGLCGFASGFAYNAVLSSVRLWYPDRQGLISGILLMGFGIGAFLIGKTNY